MIDAPDSTSTRPYLIRALYEWCTDNGFTPHVAVLVDESVQVPREFVKQGEIVLNISFDATSELKLGNDFIEFKARFSGTPREIVVPVQQVMAIYARESGQGMSFPRAALKTEAGTTSLPENPADSLSVARGPEAKAVQLASVDSDPNKEGTSDKLPPSRPTTKGPRPTLTRIK